MDFCRKSRGFTEFEHIVDRESAVIFDAYSGLFLSYVRTLGPERNLDHRSFFSNGFIQIIFFSKKVHLTQKCKTVIRIELCCCHQAFCLLYYLGEINSGIHMCQFTFEPLHFCFRM